jgi:hypothetical protein
VTEVYKVDVALALTSNHAQVLGALSKGLLGIHGQVTNLQGAFTKLGQAAAGALSLYGSEKILSGMAKMVEHGSKLVHQQELMRIAGMSNKEIAEATGRAYQVSAQVQTTTIAENLKHLKELRYAFGDYNTAQKYVTEVSKAQGVLGVLGGKGLSDQVWPMVKALEEKGLTNKPDDFMKYLNAMTQAAVATGGRVTPEQFFQTILYGRSAAQSWDLGFIGGALPRLIQSMGGSGGRGGPGNALMTAYQAVISGAMGRQSAEVFQELGLLPQTSANYESGSHHLRLGHGPHGGVAKSMSGTIARFSPGSMKGSDLFLHNPYEWVQEILMPAIAGKLGITPGHELGEQERNKVTEYLSQAFRNRTGGSVIIQMGTQGRYLMGPESPFEKDMRLQKGAYAIDQAFETLMRNDPVMRMEAFNQQWEAMMQSFGAALVPTALKVMANVTDVFTKLSQAAGAHPGVMQALAGGIALLAGVLAGAGVGLIIAAFAAGGWVIPAFAAVITFLGALALMMRRVPVAELNKNALPPNQTAPNAYGNWTPAQKLAAGMSPISYRTGGDASLGSIVLDGPIGMVVFTDRALAGVGGRGGAGGITRASYTSAGSAISALPGGGGGAHFGMGRIPSLPSLGTNSGGFLADGVGVGLGGSSFLKARRAKFRDELTKNPGLRDEVLGMMLKEGSPQATVESLMNRMDMSGGTLRSGLGIGNPKSFYGPIRRGMLPGAIAELHRNPKLYARMNAALEAALGGSHIIGGYTDQGMSSDPNGRHFPQMHLGGNIFNDWGGVGYGRSEAYRHFIEQGLAAEATAGLHGKALRDHFGYRGRHNPEHPSAAIPPPPAHSAQIQNIIHLDGQVVARNSMKHILGGLNGPAKGPSLPDFSAARPVSI